MLQTFTLWKLASALKARGNAPEAYSAVLELGKIGNPRAIELLVQTLARGDGVARAAARELGRLGAEQAIAPLAAALAAGDVAQSAAEALVKLKPKSVPALMSALQESQAAVRIAAAGALGEIGDPRAVEALVQVVQTDDDYSVKTAAAAALGQLKDQRGIWVLVGTLRLRDEVDPERQAGLSKLRQAAQLALRRIGDPLAMPEGGAPLSAEAAAQKLESALMESEIHPRLISDVSLLSEAELTSVMKELIAASEEVSWAKLENREPVLAAHFSNYERRQRTAEIVGGELLRRGGKPLLQRVLEKDLRSHAAVQNWWNAMEFQGT